MLRVVDPRAVRHGRSLALIAFVAGWNLLLSPRRVGLREVCCFGRWGFTGKRLACSKVDISQKGEKCCVSFTHSHSNQKEDAARRQRHARATQLPQPGSNQSPWPVLPSTPHRTGRRAGRLHWHNTCTMGPFHVQPYLLCWGLGTAL